MEYSDTAAHNGPSNPAMNTHPLGFGHKPFSNLWQDITMKAVPENSAKPTKTAATDCQNMIWSMRKSTTKRRT